ncbi:MAG TPA: cupin-like domain-containing protein [Steroidobacteraceae bacterium]|nr:cupin-like domain-containing protein [Steroidobacteraceae bacterium]
MTQARKQADSQRAPHGRLLEADAGQFRNNFNVRSFMFRHNMCGHPLFQLPRLATLAEEMVQRGDMKQFVALGGKESTVVTKFTAMPQERRLADTVRGLQDSSSWLKISSADVADPEYGAFLQEVLGEIEALSGVMLRREITWSALTIFLASPHVVTPYHIDHESNFLFQINGAKQVSLFDPNDRNLLPEDQIESFYSGNFQAAQYREEFQSRGTEYPLAPGMVVHNPPLGPHWVQNGTDVSVSVSIGFCMRSLDLRARVYQVNHYLRKAGLGPTPPGRSVLSDRLKIAGIGLVSKSNPTTPDEILFSGLSRLSGPPRMVKRWIHSLRGARA